MKNILLLFLSACCISACSSAVVPAPTLIIEITPATQVTSPSGTSGQTTPTPAVAALLPSASPTVMSTQTTVARPSPLDTPTPTSAPVPVQLANGFSTASALSLLYAGRKATVDSSQVHLTDTGETLTVVLSQAYWQDSQLRHMIVLSSDRDADGCHACGSALSVATFAWHEDDHIWKSELFQEDFDVLGFFGYPPEVTSLIRIGPRKYGLMFLSDNISQGSLERYLFVYALIDDSFRKVLQIQGVRHEIGNILPQNPDYRMVMVKSEYGFVPGNNSDYYDFEIAYWGTGTYSPTYWFEKYIFDGQEYRIK